MDTRKNSVNSVRSSDEKLFPRGISLEQQQGKCFRFLKGNYHEMSFEIWCMSQQRRRSRCAGILSQK